MQASPVWYILGIGPSVIVAWLGMRAIVSRGQSQVADYLDASGILVWLMPTLSVLAAGAYAGSKATYHTFLAACAFSLINYVFGVAVARLRNHRSEESLRTTLLRHLGAQGYALGTLSVLAYFSFWSASGISPSVKVGVGFYFALIWSHMILTRICGRASARAQPLGVCDLNRRVREIAKNHGLEIGQVAVVRQRHWRGANAWALSMYGDSTVMLTEELVQKLTRDEVDAVIAHELGHCVDRNCWEYWVVSSYALAFLWLAFMALGERSINMLPPNLHSLHYVKWASLFTVPGLVGAWYSRQREREADSNVGILANPKADIAADYKLYRLADYPLDRPWWSQILASHPQGGARIRAIMRQFGISEAEAQEIFQAADEELANPSDDRYELVYGETPADVAGGEAIKGQLLDRKAYQAPTRWLRSALIAVGGMGMSIVILWVGFRKFDARYEAFFGPAGVTLFISSIIMAAVLRKGKGKLRRVMTERLKGKYGSKPESPFILADVLFNEDYDENVWQGAWLTIDDGDLLVLGEARERRIDIHGRTDLYSGGGSNSTDHQFVVVGHCVDSVPQMLLARILGEPGKGEPASIGQLEKEIGKIIASVGGKLPERIRLSKKRLARMALALAALCVAVLFVHFTIELASLNELGYYPHGFIIAVIGPMLWAWIWRRDKKDRDEKEP